MNLDLFFTIDDEVELDQTSYMFESIKEYGFSYEIIISSLRPIEDDREALNFLVKKRDFITSIIDNLIPLSFNNFPDSPGEKDFFGISIEKKNKYNDFLSTINPNSFDEQPIKSIIEKIKAEPKRISVDSFIIEFTEFNSWLNRIIKRVEIVLQIDNSIHASVNSQSNISYLGKDLQRDLDEINSKIKNLEEQKVSAIKSKIAMLVVELYVKTNEDYKKKDDNKKKKDNLKKKDFFRLIYPHIKTTQKWNEKSFIKLAESKS